MSARARFEALWETLTSEQQTLLAREYAERARIDGAYVVMADGREVPIPPILTPISIERPRLRQVAADAHAITRALTKVTVDLMEDPARAPLKQRLFGAFTTLEAEALGATWRKSEQLATVRVDFLVTADGHARALEVNSTIPAMQGYSDAIAAAFLRAVANARGRSELEANALVDDNGRNTDDLLLSLLAHHERLGGRSGEQSIAIVARAGDAQYGELSHYCRRWNALGHKAFIATPEVVKVVDGRAVVDDVIPDLIYRHIFARRLDPQSDFARMCLEPERFHLFNPISSHLEVKGMLALLSAAATDNAASARIGLDPEEREAVMRSVPWTRLLAHGATTGPAGEAIDDLPSWARLNGRALVLKRSWDYGGKGVFLGTELAEGATAVARLQSLLGRSAKELVGWSELCDYALADHDAWVVQEFVPAPTERLLRVDDDGVHARDLYVDLSAFTNLGTAPRPVGGAVRASESRIVNILGGGGLAPLVRDDVLARLLD
ncbi:MAG: hypothetical protein JWN44_4945 [Myxococcales bacterium]|nr:hypothetical protein [Myxococcales bacterium]